MGKLKAPSAPNRHPSAPNRHPSTDENPAGIEKHLLAQRKRERRLHPLRVDHRTVILVPRKKCTQAYAEQYRRERLHKTDKPSKR